MTPDTQKLIGIFNDSYERCQRSRNMNSRFVDILLGYPHIAEKFAHISADKRKRTIITSMLTSMVAITGYTDTLNNLEKIADEHQQLGVSNDDLDTWKTALLTTVSEVDPAYSEEVRAAWEYVIDSSINHMKRSFSSGTASTHL